MENKYESILKEHILNLIPTAKISIQVSEKFENLNNAEKSIFHWKNGLNMIKESNILYDNLILTRTDNYIFNSISKHIILKNNTIYGLSKMTYVTSGENNNLHGSINDIFFIGNYNTMYKFIYTLNNSVKYSLHEHLASHILNNNFILESIYDYYNIRIAVIRPTLKNIININELETMPDIIDIIEKDSTKYYNMIRNIKNEK